MADVFYVPYVRAVWQVLRYRLGASGRICLFGAGRHTRWLLEVIADLPYPVIDCIADDRPVIETMAGYPVRHPSEIPAESIDLVLISSDSFEAQLAARARAVWGDAVEIVRLYQDLPEGPYDKRDDRAEALQMVRSRCGSHCVTPRQIVLIVDRPGGRALKLAACLREAAWQTILLYQYEPSFDVRCHYQEVQRYRSNWEALRLACQYTPVVYHVMVNSDYRVAELLVKHKPGPVVVDSYDLIFGMYTDAFLSAHPAYSAQIERERACLEEADGLCCRSRETDHLQEQGYLLGPRLALPDGCWNHPVSAAQRELRPPADLEEGPLPRSKDLGHPGRSDEPHIVYVGSVTPEKSEVGPSFVEGRFLGLARCLCRQRLHVHFYVHSVLSPSAFESQYRGYRELAASSPYVHLHRATPADRIVGEIRQYDFGMFVYNTYLNYDGVDGSSVPRGALHLSETKLRLCTSNKFFDYLDAGLPIIHNARPGSNLAKIVEPYGAGIDMGSIPVVRWGEMLRGQEIESLHAGVRRAREAHDLRRRASELCGFYGRLSDRRMETLSHSLETTADHTHANG